MCVSVCECEREAEGGGLLEGGVANCNFLRSGVSVGVWMLRRERLRYKNLDIYIYISIIYYNSSSRVFAELI